MHCDQRSSFPKSSEDHDVYRSQTRYPPVHCTARQTHVRTKQTRTNSIASRKQHTARPNPTQPNLLPPTMSDTHDFHASTASHQPGFEDEESLTPLEQEVLDEYARLLGNLNDVR